MVFRYLWRGKHTFAIAQHKHHRSIYEEADANKRRKRYARPLIDLHMKIYRYEGMPSWRPGGKTISGKIADLTFWFFTWFSLVFLIQECLCVHHKILFVNNGEWTK